MRLGREHLIWITTIFSDIDLIILLLVSSSVERPELDVQRPLHTANIRGDVIERAPSSPTVEAKSTLHHSLTTTYRRWRPRSLRTHHSS